MQGVNKHAVYLGVATSIQMFDILRNFSTEHFKKKEITARECIAQHCQLNQGHACPWLYWATTLLYECIMMIKAFILLHFTVRKKSF